MDDGKGPSFDLGMFGEMAFREGLKKLVRSGALKMEVDRGEYIRVGIDYNTTKKNRPGEGDIAKGSLNMAGKVAREIRDEVRRYEADRRSKGGFTPVESEESGLVASDDGGRAEKAPASGEGVGRDGQGVLPQGAGASSDPGA